MPDYGSDYSCVTDLSPNMTVISGPMVVVQAVLRRLQTPRGGLWYDRDYGTDLRQFLNGSPRRFRVARAVESEALKDERVQSADAEVLLEQRKITVTLRLTLADGPFTLVIGVDELTVELISFDQA